MTARAWIMAGVVALGVGWGCASASRRAPGLRSEPTSEQIARELKLGEERRAPCPLAALAVRELDGRPARLAELRGKVVLLDFFATYAQPSQYMTPIYDRLHRRFGERGLVVVGVSLDQQGRVMTSAFVEALGLSYPVYLAAGETLEGKTPFGGYLEEAPTAFLLDRQGRVVTAWVGVRDENELARLVEEQVNKP